MSILFGVHPADPDHPAFSDWLASEGVELPLEKGRFPTLTELLETLQTFTGSPVQLEEITGTLISLGHPEQPDFAQILGEIAADGYFHFSFEGSQNRERTMVAILKLLSAYCGPFVLREQFGSTPLLIQSNTDVESALIEWHQRFRTKYPSSTG